MANERFSRHYRHFWLFLDHFWVDFGTPCLFLLSVLGGRPRSRSPQCPRSTSPTPTQHHAVYCEAHINCVWTLTWWIDVCILLILDDGCVASTLHSFLFLFPFTPSFFFSASSTNARLAWRINNTSLQWWAICTARVVRCVRCCDELLERILWCIQWKNLFTDAQEPRPPHAFLFLRIVAIALFHCKALMKPVVSKSKQLEHLVTDLKLTGERCLQTTVMFFCSRQLSMQNTLPKVCINAIGWQPLCGPTGASFTLNAVHSGYPNPNPKPKLVRVVQGLPPCSPPFLHAAFLWLFVIFLAFFFKEFLQIC